MFWCFLPVPRRQDRWLQPKSALWCRTRPTHRVLTRSQVRPPSSTAPPLPHCISSHSSPVRLLSSPSVCFSASCCQHSYMRDSSVERTFWFLLFWWILRNCSLKLKKKAKKGDKILFLKYFYDKKKHDWSGFILGLLKNLKQIQQAWNSTRHWKNPKCFKILWAHSHFTQRREPLHVIRAHDAHDHIQKIADAEHIHAWFCCTNKTSLLVSYGCWRVLTNQRQHETSAIFSWT